jgi:hypothetical protein
MPYYISSQIAAIKSDIRSYLPVCVLKHTCRQVGTKVNENVIPAKAGIQKPKGLDSRLHGNDGLGGI